MKTYEAGEDIAIYRRVKLVSNKVYLADSAEESIGVSHETIPSGGWIAVKLWNESGTFKIETSESILVNGYAYGSDDGKVAASGSETIGKAIESVTSGCYLEINLSKDYDANELGYSISGNTLAVSSVGGTGDRFATLQAAYDWLKSSDRDAEMGVLSSTNKRLLYLDGTSFDLSGSTLILDTKYCNMASNGTCVLYGDVLLDAIKSTEGVGDYSYKIDKTSDELGIICVKNSNIELSGFTIHHSGNTAPTATKRLVCLSVLNIADETIDYDSGDISGSQFTITHTGDLERKIDVGDEIYIERDDEWLVVQAITEIVVAGETLAIVYNFAKTPIGGNGTDLSFKVARRSNIYKDLKFSYNSQILISDHFDLTFSSDLEGGLWENCWAERSGFRMEYLGEHHGMMINCESPTFGFFGDQSVAIGDGSFASGRYINCRCQVSGFGGCGVFGCDINEHAVFVSCQIGRSGLARQREFAGTLYNCSVGNQSGGYRGVFSGKAISSTFTGDVLSGSTGKFSGKLVGCDLTIDTNPIRFEGGTVENCNINQTTDGKDCITLLDSNSKITHSEIKVVQGGTGIPINAGSALNVAISQCVMNNASNDADGLGTNVTNLVATPYNVVDDNI